MHEKVSNTVNRRYKAMKCSIIKLQTKIRDYLKWLKFQKRLNRKRDLKGKYLYKIHIIQRSYRCHRSRRILKRLK